MQKGNVIKICSDDTFRQSFIAVGSTASEHFMGTRTDIQTNRQTDMTTLAFYSIDILRMPTTTACAVLSPALVIYAFELVAYVRKFN